VCSEEGVFSATALQAVWQRGDCTRAAGTHSCRCDMPGAQHWRPGIPASDVSDLSTRFSMQAQSRLRHPTHISRAPPAHRCSWRAPARRCGIPTCTVWTCRHARSSSPTSYLRYSTSVISFCQECANPSSAQPCAALQPPKTCLLCTGGRSAHWLFSASAQPATCA